MVNLSQVGGNGTIAWAGVWAPWYQCLWWAAHARSAPRACGHGAHGAMQASCYCLLRWLWVAYMQIAAVVVGRLAGHMEPDYPCDAVTCLTTDGTKSHKRLRMVASSRRSCVPLHAFMPYAVLHNNFRRPLSNSPAGSKAARTQPDLTRRSNSNTTHVSTYNTSSYRYATRGRTRAIASPASSHPTSE